MSVRDEAGARGAATAGVTRRSFLGLCAATAACAFVGGAGVAFASDEELLRPPGAGSESDFLACCVKCDRCRSVCPTGAIDVATLEQGLLVARTPVMDFHRGYCDFCGKCVEVCATGALGLRRALDPSIEKLGVAIVQKDRCLSFQQTCTACVDSCAYGALTFDASGHPTIDADLCNGCGACENDCVALVYGAFSGGTRRGIVTVTVGAYERLGTTLVEGEVGVS